MISRTSVLERLFSTSDGQMPAEVARHVLQWAFESEDNERYAELAAKSNEGVLSEGERVELDEFVWANTLLMIVQSKARVALKQQTSAA